MNTLKIKTQNHPNEKAKTFHLNNRISFSNIHHFMDGDIDISDIEEVGNVGCKIVERLFNIDGINSIFIGKYEMDIHLAEMFDWTPELEKAVFDTIQFTIDEYRSK